MNHRCKHKIVVCLLIVLFLCGCTIDSREIDQRTIVLGLGIDKDEHDQFVVTVQVPVIVPREGAVSTSEFETITGRGESLWDAISNIEANTPTVLFFGHLKAAMFGEKLAREGIDQVLDVLDRRAPLANQVFLLIIREKTGLLEFLDNESPLVNLPSLYIDRFFEADQKLSRSTDTKLFQFRRDMNMVSKAGTIPFAYVDENIVIEDMAIFQEGKLVGEFTGKEAGSSELIRRHSMNNMNYSITLEQEGISVDVSTRVDTKLDFSFKKTNPVQINLDVEGIAELVYLSDRRFNTTRSHLDDITKKLEQEIKADIERTLNKGQDLNVDPWLIGHRIWAKDYPYFKSLNWDEGGIQNAVFNINVNVELEQTGQRGILDKRKIGR